MSTYIVAFHISDYAYLANSPVRRIPKRIFTEPAAINSSELALEASNFLIEAFTDLFGIEYSLAKMDHVAIRG